MLMVQCLVTVHQQLRPPPSLIYVTQTVNFYISCFKLLKFRENQKFVLSPGELSSAF